MSQNFTFANTKDFAQGQGEYSSIRQLLRQYVPLNGEVSMPEVDIPPQVPGENCLARGATNKYDDDDINTKNKSSSKGEETEIGAEPVENHSCAATPRERDKSTEPEFLHIRAAYEKATGNRWNQSDSEAYDQNSITKIPVAKTISVLEVVARRTPTKINSFKYFVKEITALPDPRNRAWQKKRLGKIVQKVRDISVGRANYSMADFVEDVKCSCAREGISFDNDVFNELAC